MICAAMLGLGTVFAGGAAQAAVMTPATAIEAPQNAIEKAHGYHRHWRRGHRHGRRHWRGRYSRYHCHRGRYYHGRRCHRHGYSHGGHRH